MRSSLRQAKCGRRDFKACAAPGDPDECANAVAEIQELVNEAPIVQHGPRSDQHVNAAYCMRNAEDQAGAFNFDVHQPFVAATRGGGITSDFTQL